MKDPVLEDEGVTEGDLVLELVKEPVLEGVCVTVGVRVRLPDWVCVPERVPDAVLERDCEPVCVRVGVTVGEAVMDEVDVRVGLDP